jgi:Protein of unknown function (DUF5672)
VKLQLPDVTLVALDTVCHELTMLAVKESMDKVQFGAIHVHTNDFGPYQRAGIDGRHFPIAPFPSVDDAMNYLWYGVPRPIETSHFLMVQWDSGIVSPAQWSDDFLVYDYVGAPWGWHGDAHEVGNGGFSLRSRRLMQHIAERRERFPLGHPEDDFLCRKYRSELERHGFRWAPIDAASRFSFERTGFSGSDRHFGYHGIFNWPRVFALPALQERTLLAIANKYLNHPQHLGELLHAMKAQLADVGATGGDAVALRRPA